MTTTQATLPRYFLPAEQSTTDGRTFISLRCSLRERLGCILDTIVNVNSVALTAAL